MNKFLKTTLVSAIMAISGFATTIEGTENIAENGLLEIKNNDYLLTGTMTLSGSETEGQGSKVVINSDKTFEIQGGTLSYTGSETYNPQITLNGTLKLSPNSEGQMPIVKLEDINITNTRPITGISVMKSSPKTITSITEYGPVTAYYDGQFIYLEWKGKFYIPSSSGGGNFSVIPDTRGKFQVTSDKSYIKDGNNIYEANNMTELVRENLGFVDMSLLREYSEDAKELLDLSTNISGISPIALASTKLPFNVKFSNVNLTNVDKIEYTKLTINEISGPGIEENIIKKVVTRDGGVYGDYATNSELGVTLPSDSSKLVIDEKVISGNIIEMKLSELASDTETYNIAGLKLLTDDLDESTHVIAEETVYNFGFIGSKAISVSGEDKAKFLGNNANYNPADNSLTLPAEVEFAGNNSLFPITQTYAHGTFTTGELSNEIPANKVVTFSNGFFLGSDHTLTVKGNLII